MTKQKKQEFLTIMREFSVATCGDPGNAEKLARHLDLLQMWIDRYVNEEISRLFASKVRIGLDGGRTIDLTQNKKNDETKN